MVVSLPSFNAEVARQRNKELERGIKARFREESCEALAFEGLALLEQMFHNGINYLGQIVVSRTPEGEVRINAEAFQLLSATGFVGEALLDVAEEKCGFDFQKLVDLIESVRPEVKRQYAESMRGIMP